MSETAAQREVRALPAIDRLLSDERLARRAAAGDERAFAAIFRRHHQGLYRFCLAIVASAEDAQEALQNTMVKALRALPGEEREVQLKPWLYRVAHNESIDLLRRRRESAELSAEQAAPGAGLAEEAATRERLRRLIADVAELPERQRGALVMRELSGLDFDEIAAALGTTPATARQTLYEARLGLREMDEGREMSCQAVMRTLSDGDGRVTRRRDVRAHLRGCADCREFRAQIKARERDLGALAPLPAAGAAALLHGLLGGGSGGGGGGLAAALGGGAAKTAGASALLKGAATVAVVAAIGVTAADRGGLIHVVGSDRGGEAKAAPAAPADPSASSSSSLSQSSDSAAYGSAKSSHAAGVAGSAVARRARRLHRRAANPASAAGGSAAATKTAAGGAHAHGRGHEKQFPVAAAKGQGTAAIHRSAAHGAVKGERSHPSKPSHPVHPHRSAASQPAKPAPPVPAPEPKADGGGANQGATVEVAPAGRESGKKP